MILRFMWCILEISFPISIQDWKKYFSKEGNATIQIGDMTNFLPNESP